MWDNPVPLKLRFAHTGASVGEAATENCPLGRRNIGSSRPQEELRGALRRHTRAA